MAQSVGASALGKCRAERHMFEPHPTDIFISTFNLQLHGLLNCSVSISSTLRRFDITSQNLEITLMPNIISY